MDAVGLSNIYLGSDSVVVCLSDCDNAILYYTIIMALNSVDAVFLGIGNLKW